MSKGIVIRKPETMVPKQEPSDVAEPSKGGLSLFFKLLLFLTYPASAAAVYFFLRHRSFF